MIGGPPDASPDDARNRVSYSYSYAYSYSYSPRGE